MSEGLLARLRRGDVLVGDGAWGTLLMQRGLPAGQPPEWFALESPEVLEEVDPYTRQHSVRVSQYAVRLASLGKIADLVTQAGGSDLGEADSSTRPEGRQVRLGEKPQLRESFSSWSQNQPNSSPCSGLRKSLQKPLQMLIAPGDVMAGPPRISLTFRPPRLRLTPTLPPQ